jgi:hypothetical protein
MRPIPSFQKRVRFLFHAWRVTFNPIYMVETMHPQYFSLSIIYIEHEEEEVKSINR